MAQEGTPLFTEGAQVNARFAGGVVDEATLRAALRRLGLGDDRVTIFKCGAPGPDMAAVRQGELHATRRRDDLTEEQQVVPTFTKREGEPSPGLVTQLQELVGGEPNTEKSLTVLARLEEDEELAGPVAELFEQLGAMQVTYYPAVRLGARG